MAVHCKPRGAFLIPADHVAETFERSTGHGGHDGTDGRALRYLEWTHDPEPDATTYAVDYAYALRVGDHVTLEHDRHVNGLFSRATWERLIEDAGLDGRATTHTFSDGATTEVFAGTRR